MTLPPVPNSYAETGGSTNSLGTTH